MTQLTLTQSYNHTVGIVVDTVANLPAISEGSHQYACSELGIDTSTELEEEDTRYERYWELVSTWIMKVLIEAAQLQSPIRDR